MVSIRWKQLVACASVGLVITASALRTMAADTTPKAEPAADAKPTDAVADAKPALKLPLPLVPGAAEAKAEPAITLTIGSPAPPLVLGTWIKGEPIESIKAGQVYVVEFWATWCGPCLAGMPHVSALQTQYGDAVRILGISREKDEVVTEWLKTDREEGVTWDQTITYSLAMDRDETMTSTYFRAAGRTGIPSAFIVGKDGFIEWIGHPARIDEPLAKVTDGTWDRAAAKSAYDEELRLAAEAKKAAAEIREAQLAISSAMKDKDWDTALKLVDEQLEKTPRNVTMQMTKLGILSMSEKANEAEAYLAEMIKADWDQGSLLGSLALGMASKRYPGSLDDAERLAKRAVELSGEKNFVAMHTLAKVFSEKGQWDDAIAWEQKAFNLSNGNPVIKRTLADYQAKKEAAAGEPKPAAP